MADEQRTVKVKSITGEVIEFKTNSNLPVSDFRKLIHEKTGVSPQEQRLIHRAKLLLDEQSLSDFVKDNEQTIHLVKKQADAPQQPG
jgi:ubiquitin-like protein Nedd8